MKSSMKRENIRYWLFGIVGAVCFGIGDWMLGYVDPDGIGEAISVIRAGHGAGYDLKKIAATVLLGAVGVPFLLLGCARIAELETEETGKRRLRRAMLLLPVGWLLIHFTVSVGVYAYSWCMHAGESDMAVELARAFTRLFAGTTVVASLFALYPLLLLTVDTLRGKMTLPKSSLLFSPILWMALLSALKFVVPPTPLMNGIDTFCMNAGLIVWFAYLIVEGMGHRKS